MTQALAALRDGETFQARCFWLKAARLLDPESCVARVGFESGPKGFDDIWVEYGGRGLSDQEGEPLRREHLQCKWHTTPGDYGYAELVDPEFINANARSLLQRAHAAQRAHAPTGVGARFKLVSNWRIRRDDPLRPLVNTRTATLRLDKLFGSATDESVSGRIRKLWREHLGVDNGSLRTFARTLALAEVPDSLEELRERLDEVLANRGLRRIPSHESSTIYDDIVFRWLAQGRLEFDRQSFQAACEREGLFVGRGSRRTVVFGVKSFEHATDKLEERCDSVLDLVPQFSQRFLRPDSDWRTTLYPAVSDFLLGAVRMAERPRLVLDAHTTLAFAAGAVLDLKSGRLVEIEQRTLGRRLWTADDVATDPTWPTWSFGLETCGEGPDVAVAIGLTHDVSAAVRRYVSSSLSEVGRLLVAKPSIGPGARSVVCGRHAFDLAESITARIKSEREDSKTPPRVHLFVAGPNAFTFFLGQRRPALGNVTLYEFDFEGGRDGSYQPSLGLPILP